MLSNIKFTQYTENTVTSIDELRRQLDTILSKGYSESTDGYELGINAVAAPVRDHTGQVVASISISVPQIIARLCLTRNPSQEVQNAGMKGETYGRIEYQVLCADSAQTER